MGISDPVFNELIKIVGKDHVTQSKEDLVCYAYDASSSTFMPEAVVFPSNAEDISKIFHLAAKTHLTIIPRGSGSGMTGGALPVNGGLVMTLSRMNTIIDIDRDNFTAVVEPGVITQDLHRAVEEKGLFYPPDPASSSFCTIGGNVAECAGGPRAVKYGVTRDYVLGLEAVLPSGKIIHTGVKTAKGVAGYDLTRLIVGSEGTLAVVTKIILKLLPLPETIKTMAVLFPSMEKAARTVSAIIQNAVVPRCIEYMDKASIQCVARDFTFPVSRDTSAILLLEVDGDSEHVEKEAKKLEAICLSNGASRVFTAENQNQANDLWKARKALSPTLFSLAPNKINEDIVVPINKIPKMIEKIQDIQKRANLLLVSFGHAGDGNIHCNIMYNKRDENQCARAEKAVARLFEETLALGGTITGEHGIGITKKKYLGLEIGETELDIMKQIKQVFDPGNILNPGKIF
ncbi:MAG: FAD-linked oxidase C-terminal domain-containing protein [Thermodesulfobacteriota bacterium]|nr:FAD-linked oxidase C-terminal domain-containing protein [Thermodesulfobacteriota bacterium]